MGTAKRAHLSARVAHAPVALRSPCPPDDQVLCGLRTADRLPALATEKTAGGWRGQFRDAWSHSPSQLILAEGSGSPAASTIIPATGGRPQGSAD